MALVVRDPELLLDHLGDAGTGPDLAPEPVSLGTMPEEFGDKPLLAGCEPRGSPRTGTSEERFAATDANKDGELTEAEYVGEYQARLEGQLKASDETAEKQEEQRVRQIPQAHVPLRLPYHHQARQHKNSSSHGPPPSPAPQPSQTF